MSDKEDLTPGDKVTTEAQSRPKGVNPQAATAKDNVVKPNPDNSKGGNGKNNKFRKPQLSKEELELKRQRTEENKKNRDLAIALYKQRFDHFSKLYPNCFNDNHQPLAIGIHNSMLEEEEQRPEDERINKTFVRRFLAKYTRSKAYKECLQSGSARVNLQGEENGIVTPEHAEIAQKSLEEWRSKQATHRNNNNKKPKE